MVSGPRRAIGPPKSTIIALRAFIEDEGPAPPEVLEARLLSEFGWTLSELDEQDEARALRILAAKNIEATLRLVGNAVASHRPETVPPDAWKLWDHVISTESEK